MNTNVNTSMCVYSLVCYLFRLSYDTRYSNDKQGQTVHFPYPELNLHFLYLFTYHTHTHTDTRSSECISQVMTALRRRFDDSFTSSTRNGHRERRRERVREGKIGIPQTHVCVHKGVLCALKFISVIKPR